MKLSRLPQMLVATTVACLWQSFAFGGVVLHHVKVPNDPNIVNQATITSALNASAPACVFPDGTNLGAPFAAYLHCLTPATLTAAYGIDQVHAQGLTGKGQVVGTMVSGGSPTLQADLDTFSDAFNLPKTQIQFVYVNGATPITGPMTADEEGWADECTLDVTCIHAVAPEATIVVVVMPAGDDTTGDGNFPFFDDAVAGINAFAAQYPNSTLSMSFGSPESTFTTAEIQKITSATGEWQEAVNYATSQGVTLFASAGDSGTFNGASFPTSDPRVTSVGGTWLMPNWKWAPTQTMQAANLAFAEAYVEGGDITPSVQAGENWVASKVQTEAVWNEPFVGILAATGGQPSTLFAEPIWQALLPASIQKLLRNHRGFPDVALTAAVDGGYQVYTSFDSANTGWTIIGGTSASSPCMAALTALANQKVASDLGENFGVGLLTPMIYTLPKSDFNDIVSQTFSSGKAAITLNTDALWYNRQVYEILGLPTTPQPGYSTLSGYDLTTGRGSPKALKFVTDVAASVELRFMSTRPLKQM